jgi:fluoride ion exporter CrcB/FEX
MPALHNIALCVVSVFLAALSTASALMAAIMAVETAYMVRHGDWAEAVQASALMLSFALFSMTMAALCWVAWGM